MEKSSPNGKRRKRPPAMEDPSAASPELKEPARIPTYRQGDRIVVHGVDRALVQYVGKECGLLLVFILVFDIFPITRKGKPSTVRVKLPDRAYELEGDVVGASPLALERPADRHEVVDRRIAEFLTDVA